MSEAAVTLLRERPHGRPVDVALRIEPGRNDVVGMAAGVDFVGMVKLPVAEELDVVRVDRLLLAGRGKIRKAFLAADLVAMER